MVRATLGDFVKAAVFVAAVATQVLTATVAAQTRAARTGGVPIFEVDPSWPNVPVSYRLGDASSIGIDAQDNVWILSRPRTLKPDLAAMAAPAILVFDTAGNFIRAWAAAGSGYEWPEREHGIHIDHRGYVWVGGNQCPARNLPGLKQVWDDQLLFDADTGKFKRMWGAFGNKPVGEGQCPQPALKAVPDGPGPQHFTVVHAIRVANDGTVYVADRENRRVQMFTSDGKFLKQFIRHNAPFARNLALSPDPEQRFLYVGGGVDIVVLDRKTLEMVELIGGPGFLGGGHQIATDSKGNIYVAATARGLQKLVFKGIK